MRLSDILDIREFNTMIAQKYVKTQTHPDFPELRIANYTDSAMWDQVWNDVTMTCRGLIFDVHTEEIIARPFKKFFNYEQEQAPTLDLQTRLHVTDKMDGSLGILYQQPDGNWAIATRGSFASDQALWATGFYESNYSGQWDPNPQLTYLFEIIYPSNRVVIDYGDLHDLVLIGAVDIASGRSISIETAAEDWAGPVVPVMYRDETLETILSLPPRSNAEGFVLWEPRSDSRIKIKYEDYKRLHRFLTNTSEKHVWEVMMSGEDPRVVFAEAPDEFHDWLKEVINKYEILYSHEFEGAKYEFSRIVDDLGDEFSRKDFAEKAKGNPYQSHLFKMLDGKSIDEIIWRALKPVGVGSTVRLVSSDAD